MESKAREFRRPLNHLYKRDWYWDHDKRLYDAEVAQNGINEDGLHSDGVHRHELDPFDRVRPGRVTKSPAA